MINNLKFWIPMVVFQVVFGLTIFTITRQYYIQASDNVSKDPVEVRQSSSMLPDSISKLNPSTLNWSAASQSILEDPAEISRQANDSFAKKQYGKAAELYEQLLTLAPDNVETYNNLGITLHYLGRPTDALRWLNKGVTIDPLHQRIWLTLGFVNSQSGNTEKARTALTTATKIDANNEIGKSATEMLGNLP
jgi:tetratricopeptide (TPR) repeat protein